MTKERKRELPAAIEMAVKHALTCYPNADQAVTMLLEFVEPPEKIVGCDECECDTCAGGPSLEASEDFRFAMTALLERWGE